MRVFYTQLFVFLFTCQLCISATHDRTNVLNTFKAWCDHKQIPKLPSTSILLEEPEYFLFSPASKVQKAMQEWDSTYPETGYMIQFCFREKEIEAVGNPLSLTCFEMFFYYKAFPRITPSNEKKIIDFECNLLNKWLHLSNSKLGVIGLDYDHAYPEVGGIEKHLPLFQEYEISRNNIYLKLKAVEQGLGEGFWGPIQEIGPCGPSFAIYFTPYNQKTSRFSPTNKRWFEIAETIFFSYYKNKHKKLQENHFPFTCFGIGIERIITALEEKEDCFQTSLFTPIIQCIEKLSSKEYSQNKYAMRIIADHIRTACFLLADSSEYLFQKSPYKQTLQKLIHRTLTQAEVLDLHRGSMEEIATVVFNTYPSHYTLQAKKAWVLQRLSEEEDLMFSKNRSFH